MPQVQEVNMPSWGSALGQFGGGILDEYTQNLKRGQQEDAMQKMLADVKKRRDSGESDEDIIESIYGARGVPFEQKKNFGDLFSQSKKNKQAALKEQQTREFEREKYETSKKQKERELDIKEDAARNKRVPKSEYEKTKEREMAKAEAEIMKEIPKIDSALRMADQVAALIEETTGFGSLNLSKQSELSVRAAALLEPMIKIYNPTGQVSQIKLKWINDKFGINATDTRWTQRGKLVGIRSLLTEQRKRLDERQQLIQDWNGNPPMEKLRQFDDESEKIYDAITGWDERSAESGIFNEATMKIQEQLKDAPKDKVIKGPEGRRYKWMEDKWVQI